MKREQSDSITHLVKIVAEEVFDEKMKKMSDISSLNDIGTEFCFRLQSNLQKAGESWTRGEDVLLIQEVKTAIAQIAKNHSRSISAIQSRIMQKELIY